jgi:CHAT domain-containing protein
MARLLRLSTLDFGVLGLSCAFASLLVGAVALYGQASTPPALQSPSILPNANTWSPPVGQPNTWTPQTNGFPNAGSNWNPPLGNVPGPYTRPTQEQTSWYVNNHPAFNNLDPGIKQAIIGSGGSVILNSPNLPNGNANPFYSSTGQAISNWYLPGTWLSPNMNWQGVQPNGYLPTYSSTYNGYSPSSINTSYNPSYGGAGYTTYNYSPNYTYNYPSYQQTQPPPRYAAPGMETANALRNTLLMSSTSRSPTQDFSRSVVDLKSAIEGRERALAVKQAAGDKVALVSSHAELARLLIQAGKPDQALIHVNAAESLAKATGDMQQRAELLRIKGAAYMVGGDFEQAVSAYSESIATIQPQQCEIDSAALFARIDPKSQARKRTEAEALTGIGWAYQSMGDVTKALHSYESAKTLFTDIGDNDGLVRSQLAIASAYRSIGELDKAYQQYREIRPQVQTSEDIQLLVSFAEVMESRGKSHLAMPNYEKALEQAQRMGDPSAEAVILAGIGRHFLAMGMYPTAADEFARALAKMRKTGNRAGEAGVIANFGELYYWESINSPKNEAKRYFRWALYYYNQALPLMREVGERNGEIGVLANIGLLYDTWRKPNEALNYYLQALQKMEQLQASARLEEFRMDVSDQSVGLYQRAVILEFNQHNMHEAFELSERARARAFLNQISEARSQSSARLPTEFSAREEKLRKENILLERQIGQELSKPGPEINTERLQALQARLAAVHQAYEDAVRDLKISNPDLASLIMARPLPLPELQKQLGPDVTVVSYFTAADKTLAFVITRNTFDVVKLRVTAPELATAIATFRDFSGESSGTTTLKELHKWLLAPLKSHLKTFMLAIVPHGPLNDLPFAALTPDGENFISDKHAVFYLPSVNVLPYLHAKSDPGSKPILVMANDESPGAPRLVYARDEGRAVANLWDAQPVTGKVATAAYLSSHAGDYGIVHIAAHVSTDHEYPQFSRIVTGEGKEDEGELELNQVVGLDLRKTNLVVVSGCESQLGRRTRGDDVIGLSRAFMFAGSPSVIASLWNVDDEVTQELMVAFYTHLKAGLSKAEALRAAETDVRKQHPNPYYWAGFVLMGDPGSAGTLNLVASATK